MNRILSWVVVALSLTAVSVAYGDSLKTEQDRLATRSFRNRGSNG